MTVYLVISLPVHQPSYAPSATTSVLPAQVLQPVLPVTSASIGKILLPATVRAKLGTLTTVLLLVPNVPSTAQPVAQQLLA